jgi:hypothetical protein
MRHDFFIITKRETPLDKPVATLIRNSLSDLLVEVGDGDQYYCEKGPGSYADTNGDIPRG